jgi:hypothetical protein
MLTIEEAIEHAEDVAVSAIGCECAAEHRQLAAWLRELQERRKMPEIIKCKDCVHALICNRKIDFGSGLFFIVSSCSMAERRAE